MCTSKYNGLANLRSQTYKEKHAYRNLLCDTKFKGKKKRKEKAELDDNLSPFSITHNQLKVPYDLGRGESESYSYFRKNN